MNKQQILSVIDWLCNGRTGLSSRHMAAVACGVEGAGNHPLDSSDLSRCLALVQHEPSVRDHFDAIAETSPEWFVVIRHWDELTALLKYDAGKCYDRMKELGL